MNSNRFRKFSELGETNSAKFDLTAEKKIGPSSFRFSAQQDRLDYSASSTTTISKNKKRPRTHYNGWSVGEETGQGAEGDGEGPTSLGICWSCWRQFVQMEGHH
jgi:hypothetical protein